MARPPKRTREAWTALALEALADGGLPAVGIEPLARRAGVTKGSLYWYFENRDALLRATLERWEHDFTEVPIEHAQAGDGPLEHLRRLFGAVLSPGPGVRVELALLAATDEPLVADAVARVSERRLDWLAAEFRALGLPPAAARRRAVIAYSVYVGQAQLTLATPGLVPRGQAARRTHVDEVLATLLAGTTADDVEQHTRREQLDRVLDEELPRYSETLRRLGE